MKITNFEFKARVDALGELEQKLQSLNPDFQGEDHQIDTYFGIAEGRLKLREGNIENSLIYYHRPDAADSKQSDVLLYPCPPEPGLKAILSRLHGIKVVVEKWRRIYFIDNVKFHFDRVKDLGYFMEVEAIAREGEYPLEQIQAQCRHYQSFFGIEQHQFIDRSYSDLLLDL
ncbi:MAG: class IV adenylate cyclase, partial [Phaeodactylibacter sp.]|nr:class IV adenylate cyclase [Phaeodactylibacter sp.]